MANSPTNAHEIEDPVPAENIISDSEENSSDLSFDNIARTQWIDDDTLSNWSEVSGMDQKQNF
jgi:hypothetical protein